MKKYILKYRSFWLPVLFGIVLLPVPLLGDLHIESALLVALIGCFWAGIKSCNQVTEKDHDLKRIWFILRTLYLVGAPLLLYAIAVGCFSWNGIGFWMLYPVPSVVFGYAFGHMLRLFNVSYRKWLTVLFLTVVAVGVLLIEFFNLPQVYFYNHVWGGWPGPIYDETITVSWSLVFFRVMTLLWAALFWAMPRFTTYLKPKIVAGICVVGLTLGYSFLPRLGIISPRSYIQQQLGGVKQTPHFVLYYDKQSYTHDEIKLLALEHEFYFHQITQKLELNDATADGKIESYLYGNVWQKNRLTGAKFTSYVPVWLEQDQLHIAKQQLGSLKHEMVHILAKQFGNEVLNASWSIGLVEGVAVALAGKVSPRSTIHQIVAAQQPWPDAEAMKNMLSLTGFYGGRSTVNYTTAGSFIRYLLNHYPVKDLKIAYKTAEVEKGYGKSIKKLVGGWHQYLSTVAIDSVDKQIAGRLFSIPSLFEQQCPHVLSAKAQHLQNYRYALIVKDTAAAMRELSTLKKMVPRNGFVTSRWMMLKLKTGKVHDVLQINQKQLRFLRTKLRHADALVLSGQWEAGQKYAHKIAQSADSIRFFEKQLLQIRRDAHQWKFYISLIYKGKQEIINDFNKFTYFLKMLAIKKSIKEENWVQFIDEVQILSHISINSHYIGVYLEIIHMLGYKQEFRLAQEWIDKIGKLKLRKRSKQRLNQQKQWLIFLNDFKKYSISR